jgi:hypothetical protein
MEIDDFSSAVNKLDFDAKCCTMKVSFNPENKAFIIETDWRVLERYQEWLRRETQ